jgi:drug/metabolite transporter (DMT)-like permease
MKGLAALLLSILLAVVCWGVYGPTLNEGRAHMGGSSLRPFICVGLAYFLIAVLAPVIWLRTRGESGHWSTSGIIWSLAAGAAGAIGALGVILALALGGSPLYVMPLVFGCAPVVNTFLTMYWGKSFKQMSPVFIAGLILVIVGAVTVLIFRPQHGPPPAQVSAAAPPEREPGARPTTLERVEESRVMRWGLVMLFTGMTALAWGVYGPTLHRGQMGMAGSRLRPLICVGLSYFLIAVIVPTLLLAAWDEPGGFTVRGSIWSLLGGATGGLGALGIIMAFNFGGKPVFVMPLVFGGAPVVNTFVSVTQSGSWGELHSMFFAGLIVVMAGAVTVLVFAPKPPHGAHAETKPEAEAAPA